VTVDVTGSFDVTSLAGRRADNRWDRVCVGDILERMALSDPDREAFVAHPDAVADPRFARLTYRAADLLANRIANALLASGLQRSDRVAMLCDNTVEGYVTKIAAAKAGLVVVPVNPMLAPDVVEHMLRHVEAVTAIVDAELWPRLGEAFVAAGVRPLATICLGGGPVAGSPSLSDLVDDAPDTEPDVRIHGDDIWEILLTSGTTAMPKAVMLSHTYSYMVGQSYALSYSRGLRLECDVRTGTFLPQIYHVSDHGCVLAALMSGGTAVLGRRLTAAAAADMVTRERITGLWAGSPQFLADLVSTVDADPLRSDLRSLTVVVFGWSAIAPGLTAALKRLAGGELALIEVFGQTEANACHRFWFDRWPEKHLATAPETNYVGIPGPILGSDVVDEEGRSLRDRPGVPGEAVYRSPAVTAGYYKDEAATAAAFRGGWFHSGDSCTYDEDGLRIMVDRYKDIVKSGGENVSSIRVETVLHQHPAVSRAAVIGLPHERWGEAVTAVVVVDGAVLDVDELIAFCRQRLAGYETPKSVVVVDELPQTVGGKILKYRLRSALTGSGAQA
jgi:acyl-CoA synthetase (AMP-forming)/AMP-acid ligase II